MADIVEKPGADAAEKGKSIASAHFVGIGGAGMSGIALVLNKRGCKVTGSDLKSSHYVRELEDAGIDVTIGHDAATIDRVSPEVVVTSSAIPETNPEVVRARELGIPIWPRAKMLSYLSNNAITVAVAGTHGKTTTSSMIATMLDRLGWDPSFLIGGVVEGYDTNGRNGEGGYFVCEADESDGSFLYLNPDVVVVTNIEADHLDHYKDLDEIYDKFHDFMGLVPEDGVIVACGDEPHVVEIARSEGRRMYTYGFNEGCDVRITSYEPHGIGSRYTAVMPDGTQVEGAIKQNPGRHNVLNATGVVTLLWALGFDAAKVAQALSGFAGVRRRFDLVGEVGGVTVVDDYAHHPTEIAATISAAAGLGYKHVHVLFQPHRYSRAPLFTQVLHDEFGAAFDKADSVTFMDVYPAGEAPVPGVSGKTFLNVVLEHEGHPQADFVAHRVDVVPHLMDELQPGDLVITMGAGDVTAMGPQIIDALLKARG